MLFVDLNDNFSCQEFDRLLCNCSVKGFRENTMRKTTRLVYVVTLPETGQSRQSPHRHNSNSPHAPTYNVLTSFDAFILPLEKSSEVEQRDRHVCTSVVVTYIIRVESSEEL
jgi:hypothetical protein